MQEKNINHLVVGDIATNCWIYPLDTDESLKNTGGAAPAPLPDGFQYCALIDPGAEGERIIARLNQLKLVPRFILLTHGHFDHIGAVPAIAAAYGGPGSTGPLIAIHQGYGEYLGSGSFGVHCRSFTAAAGSAAYIEALWEDMPPPCRTLAEGDRVGPFTVLHLPGHTPGSVGFWDAVAQVLFSGDTLFQGDYGRTDLPGGDETALFASLRRLCAMDGGTRVFPGHGPVTCIAAEARSLGF